MQFGPNPATAGPSCGDPLIPCVALQEEQKSVLSKQGPATKTENTKVCKACHRDFLFRAGHLKGAKKYFSKPSVFEHPTSAAKSSEPVAIDC